MKDKVLPILVGLGAAAVLAIWLAAAAGGSSLLSMPTPTGDLMTCTTYTSTDVPKSIPDDDPTGITSALSIASLAYVGLIEVSLNISHTWDSDLHISLISPAGGSGVLIVDSAGGSGDNFAGTNLYDGAETAIGSGSAPFTGDYRPSNPLDAFIGQAVNGTWTLKVVDTAGGDTGTLNAWQLTVCTTDTPLSTMTPTLTPTATATRTPTRTPLPTGPLFTDHANCGNGLVLFQRVGTKTPIADSTRSISFSNDCANWAGAIEPINTEGTVVTTPVVLGMDQITIAEHITGILTDAYDSANVSLVLCRKQGFAGAIVTGYEQVTGCSEGGYGHGLGGSDWAVYGSYYLALAPTTTPNSSSMVFNQTICATPAGYQYSEPNDQYWGYPFLKNTYTGHAYIYYVMDTNSFYPNSTYDVCSGKCAEVYGEDSINVDVLACLTPTPTKTVTPTRTATPTRTLTPTATLLPTDTRAPTSTQTPTRTRTPTVTVTATRTPTATRTNTPTATVAPTVFGTKTPRPSRTPLCAGSCTPVPSRTPCPNCTPPPTKTVYPGYTPYWTRTPDAWD